MESVGVTPGFWRGRRVFLTGHTGFKGSWLALWLQHMGALVTGYALVPSDGPSLFSQAAVGDSLHSIMGDVRDLDLLQSAMQTSEPEVVIHMAAQALVRESYAKPVDTYSTNVMGTVHVLEAVRYTPSVRAVVNVTTDKCYENHEWIWGYRENEAMGGFDPYSSSKGCSELVTAAYRNSFFSAETYASHGVALASARAGNVIGGGDYAKDRLIPDIVTAFAQRKSVFIRQPNAIRPWQHVLEPLRGYLSLAEKLHAEGPTFASAWNFGPRLDDTQTVQWMVEHLAKLWGPSAQWQLDPGAHPHEAHSLRLDITKARQLLQWEPVLNLSTALSMVVQWYQRAAAGESPKALCLAHIQQYEEILAFMAQQPHDQS
jgi:CDP-glucose 4,6-dehydratase